MEQTIELSLQQKRALLSQLLQKKAGRQKKSFPLSFAQQRLWFLEQWNPNSSLYNIFGGVHLSGPLNIEILKQSFNHLIQRHESLRTHFVVEDDQAAQVVESTMEIDLSIVNLTEMPKREKEKRFQSISMREARLPFDLLQGPLFRAKIVHLDEHEAVLLLNMHHIISDGGSMDLFMRELAELYEAAIAGTPLILPELPFQYRHYVSWQQHWVQGKHIETHREYWKQQLDQVPTLQLPTDYARPATQSFKGAREHILLPTELYEALKTLSRQEGVTMFMTLLAAFALLLSRYAKQDDIVLGSPIASRTRSEFERIIGFFVNMLVLRIDTAGDPTFRELLQRTRLVALDAYTHQDVPFERLVEDLVPERDISRNPLFQVMFAFQNTSLSQFKLAGVQAKPLRFDMGHSRFDISLNTWEEQNELMCLAEYSVDLFSEKTIALLLRHFANLLQEIVQKPDQRISTLSLLDAQERHLLLIERNTTSQPFALSHTVSQQFEQQAALYPTAIALSSSNGQLSYGELNARANQLARFLQQQGVGPEVLVAVCMERSIELLVAELAIVKTGGAYVPLDPAYPQSRLAYMLQEVRSPLVLTQQRLRSQVQGAMTSNTSFLCAIDTASELWDQEECSNLEVQVLPQNLAYMIYTSGSTGQPKGVQVTHYGLLNLLNWYRQTFALTHEDRIGHLMGIGFDAAVLDIWPTLTSGACLVLPDEVIRYSAALQQSWILDQKLTLCITATAIAEQLFHLSWPITTCLRYLHTGGDRLTSYPTDSIPFTIVNNYGPTENTVESTCAIVPPVSPGPGNYAVPSIGSPILNIEVYLLDENLQPVATGIIGELYLGGAGLARGYQHRPDITAERFIPHPFATQPGSRLYKTGDICRYRANGEIEFLGRNDHQVKIRGFRIELGEIEQILLQHDQVAEVVVIVREDPGFEKRLVAYLVPATGEQILISQLRKFLRGRVATYMVPAEFVVLPKFLLTPNGKVDRRSLPIPVVMAEESLELEYCKPQTEIEEQIVIIWQAVLQKEKIGIHENFFDLGGYSHLMTQIQLQLQNVFARPIPLINLFKYPTVSTLATYIKQEPAIADKMQMGAKRVEELEDGKNRLKKLRQRQRLAR